MCTGGRADYGLLRGLLAALRDDPAFELRVLATGMHLAPEFGCTLLEIERDGFAVDARVAMPLADDSPVGVAKSTAQGLSGAADALARLAPDLVFVCGDRFETLAVAQACLFLNLPLAHLAGGDTTEGAFDESIRHSITKMAHLHFVTNELAARRVRQLGENPARIHVTGSPAIDDLIRMAPTDRTELERSLGAPLLERNLLLTFHPVTLRPGDSPRQLEELLSVLGTLPSSTGLWFTGSNADVGGRELNGMVERWVRDRPNARYRVSLGQERYLGLMSLAVAVVGNSSSGLYEAPSFGVPTVDIGERQRGRLAASSVVHCEADRVAIAAALRRVLSMRRAVAKNPYGDGHGVERIMSVLRQLGQPSALIPKTFFLMDGS